MSISRVTLRRLTAGLLKTGSRLDSSSRSDEYVSAVAGDVQEDPQTSTRQRGTILGIAGRSLQQI